MSEKTLDNFEKGIFWGLYTDLESQFLNFLGYVPYLPGNEAVYSFKLLNLILSIGGYVDSAFKEMARFPQYRKNVSCQKILNKLQKSEENIEKGEHPITISIKLCLEAFERVHKLSSKIVEFRGVSMTEKVQPFKPYNPDTNAPEWWEIYNGLKHDVSVNIEDANLRNTRDALAAAFLLNVVHTPSAKRLLKYGVLKRGIIHETLEGAEYRQPIPQVERLIEEKKEFDGFASTSIFTYNYNQKVANT